ncbi:MAG: sigma-70 family RNA polymerase sigma factor [Bryobacteraceae bacterium]
MATESGRPCQLRKKKAIKMSALGHIATMPKIPGSAARSEAPVRGAAEQLTADGARWRSLVSRIRSGDDSGMRELYEIFHKGVRFYLCRQLGVQELEDKVHDTFLIVVEAIRAGELREPERLMGFVRTVVRRQVAAHIDQAVQDRKERADLDVGIRVPDLRQSPEEKCESSERAELMEEVLADLSGRDREILIRFYLREQAQEQICSEMELTTTQFRLLKSRAKARFGELGRKKLVQRSLRRFSVRGNQA